MKVVLQTLVLIWDRDFTRKGFDINWAELSALLTSHPSYRTNPNCIGNNNLSQSWRVGATHSIPHYLSILHRSASERLMRKLFIKLFIAECQEWVSEWSEQSSSSASIIYYLSPSPCPEAGITNHFKSAWCSWNIYVLYSRPSTAQGDMVAGWITHRLFG